MIMKWFNTNTLHNFLNITISIVGAVAMFDLTPFMDADLAIKITAGAAVAKLLINGIRDGIDGMIKQQPAVK